ncbi:hypothetical protein HNP12_002048 [Aeromonas hydrophila]|uniref:hypothetical protein n=1 Tax=Aeromonas TaxID=642 RepID=UPI00216792D0|nr:hypothetical protein [Aeromonas hydrophila]MCS3767977.1 hypothetical protein [Aeromonas hydrophila]MCS3792353.1 hypothetical protein [Aeromonas hydrophila]
MIAIVLAMLKMLPVGDKAAQPGENGGKAVSEIALWGHQHGIGGGMRVSRSAGRLKTKRPPDGGLVLE